MLTTDTLCQIDLVVSDGDLVLVLTTDTLCQIDLVVSDGDLVLCSQQTLCVR